VEWLNYHHLLYFWVVAQEGSVSRASAVLHVSPATVSIQIRELEKSLGVPLLQKAGRGLVLTEMGEAVHRYAGEIFALGREMVDLVRGRPLGQPLLLRVGIRDVMPKLVAYKLIEPTLTLPEPMRLVCREGDFSRLIADLAVHKLDVVLSDTPLDPHLKVRAFSHLLGESEVVIVGAPALAQRLRDHFPDSLHQAPWLLPTENNMLRRSLDLWFADRDLRPSVRGEFEDSAMLKTAGKAGIGVFAIPAAIHSEVQTMYNVELIGHIPSIKERFYAISAERKLKHPGVVAISAAARQKLKLKPIAD
jgi:LysR family transcriptional activator of nhaA